MTGLKTLIGVAVLYNCSFEKSNTIISINRALEQLQTRLTLLVYDNGAVKQHSKERFVYGCLDIIYKHNPENPGISEAYNQGVNYAIGKAIDWILLLDQDTIFNTKFFESFLAEVEETLNREIVCMVPKVLSMNNNVLFSPSIIYPGGITKRADRMKPGIILRKSITGINSGTFISPTFIESIGGFSDDYPLDMLDHWYFREIKKKKKKVALLNSTVHHNLSVLSFFEEVSIERYNSILYSEAKFFKSETIGCCIYKSRLIIRIFKQLMKGQKVYAKLTFKYLISNAHL